MKKASILIDDIEEKVIKFNHDVTIGFEEAGKILTAWNNLKETMFMIIGKRVYNDR